MKNAIIRLLERAIVAAQLECSLDNIPLPKIIVERTKNSDHGDYATNLALMLAKPAKRPPIDLAEMLLRHIPDSPLVVKKEIAGPGFINFFLADNVERATLSTILDEGKRFGQSKLGQQKRVHLEYVSANPTGPLHVGHGRGAAYGSTLANLLKAAGFNVHQEYYVNDAGRQMDILAVSVWLRYLELFGLKFTFPLNGYRGDYVLDIANDLKEKHGDTLLAAIENIYQNVPKDSEDEKEKHIDGLIFNAKEILKDRYETLHAFGKDAILDDIRDDLKGFGAEFDEWFSEKSLMDKGEIQKGLDALKAKNAVYEKGGALWFKSTQFGDEKDRVLVRDNGQSTYFASDVAYHWDKLDRGYQEIIDLFGADHHGYIPRVKAAMEALGLDHNALHVPLVQFAVLYRGKEKVQMSTRSGEFVTLRSLREEIGKDAARFFYVMRKAEQHMDFDLELAKSKSNENPVYYIQYAHARICSVFEKLKTKGIIFDRKKAENSLSLLNNEHEKALMKCLSRYPEIVESAARELEPHQICNYLRELATFFHTYYNAHQFIIDDLDLCQARLLLISAIKQVLKNGFDILGLSAPESM